MKLKFKKDGIIIGLRICNTKLSNEELDYKENSFAQLEYPKSFMQRAKTAFKIHNWKSYTKVTSLSCLAAFSFHLSAFPTGNFIF